MGLGQRASALTDHDVEQALIDGTILRAHAMRLTWHSVAAEDYRWVQELTGPRVHAFNRTLYDRNELTEPMLAKARSRPHDEALAELTRRYFLSHGLATVKDFVWWSGLKTGDAREGIALMGDAVERFVLDGVAFFHMPSETVVRVVSPTARLLQAYDEYIVAYTQSRHVLNTAGLMDTLPAGRLLYMHALTIDGQLAGHWRRVDRAHSTTVDFTLARPINAAERDAIDREVERFARFVGVPVTVTGLEG